MTAHLNINGEIGSKADWWSGGDQSVLVDAAFVDESMNDIGVNEELDVYVNSVGGDAYDSLKIYDRLMSHQGKVQVMIGSVAAGGAAWIAMAGDKVIANTYSLIRLVMPYTVNYVDEAEEVLRARDAELKALCDRIYPAFLSRNLKMTRDELVAAFEAETWFSAEEALRVGLIDAIEERSAA